ncbi:MAG TPA: SH3 domain-containing protein [bacterium]|nr:SH3 domain-containing protein [bacterium]
MKKGLLILSVSLLGVFFLSSSVLATFENEESNTNQAEFGSCYADPIYDISFVAKTIIAANVRNVACMSDSKVSFVLPANTEVKVIAKTDGWHKIKTSDGKTGWIGSTLIKEVSGESNIDYSKTEAIKTTEEAVTNADSKSVIDRVKGYIILAVEKKGEAYYVTEDGEAIYMKNGVSAFDIMRKLGLGISNANLSKLQQGDKTLKNRLSGKIVLAVEKNGEAYYINPSDLKIYYLKDGEAAFEIMRSKGLGISNANLSKISKKEASQIKTNTKTKTQTKTQTQNAEQVDKKIDLTAVYTSSGVKLDWQTNFISSMGFKVVVSEKENPVYPGNDYHYFSDKNVKSDVWKVSTPGTYYFRVCEYLGGKCGAYSNNEIVIVE